MLQKRFKWCFEQLLVDSMFASKTVFFAGVAKHFDSADNRHVWFFAMKHQSFIQRWELNDKGKSSSFVISQHSGEILWLYLGYPFDGLGYEKALAVVEP